MNCLLKHGVKETLALKSDGHGARELGFPVTVCVGSPMFALMLVL
jgi:hypothetical protein